MRSRQILGLLHLPGCLIVGTFVKKTKYRWWWFPKKGKRWSATPAVEYLACAEPKSTTVPTGDTQLVLNWRWQNVVNSRLPLNFASTCSLLVSLVSSFFGIGHCC
jgi:hypothetical protein